MRKPIEDAKWLANSVMGRRGTTGVRIGATHRLDEARQGAYHYTIGPYAEPVLTVRPGDRIVVETHDAFEGKIRSEQDSPAAILELPFVNPQNGPIRVEGAEKGDVLAVYVEAIRPRGDQPRGTTCFLPEFGGLVGTEYTAILNDPVPERVRKLVVDDEFVHWSDRVRLPYSPFLGTIGLAPEIDSISALWPGNHGGNMDLPDTAPGNVIYLPVRAAGGFLFLGDAHAAQGGRRIVRSRRRTPERNHHRRRPDQGLADRLAAHRGRGLDHVGRQRPADGGCRAHRLPGTSCSGWRMTSASTAWTPTCC